MTKSKTITLLKIIALMLIPMLIIGLMSSSGTNPSPGLTHTATGKQMVAYMNKLYPLHKQSQWESITDTELEDVYTNMQVLYTPLIGQLWDRIAERIPKRESQQSKSLGYPYSLANVKTGQPIVHSDGTATSYIPPEYSQRLFDGSVCDCMRAWVGACNAASRFSASTKYEGNCPQWSGLATVTDMGYVDQLLEMGGYPSNAFVEILTFPGEYGVPENCPLNNQPLADIENQPLKFPDSSGSILTGIPQGSGGTGPYFENPTCASTHADNPKAKYGESCVKNYANPEVKMCGFPIKDKNGNTTGWEGCECTKVQIGKNTTSQGLCLDPEVLTPAFRAKYEAKVKAVPPPVCTPGNCSSGSDYKGLVNTDVVETFKKPTNTIIVPTGMFSSSKPNVQEGCSASACSTCSKKCSVTGDDATLKKNPCPCPDVVVSPLFYYPLRGIGIWTNLSNTAACATKLGFVTTPAAGLTTSGLGGITKAGAKLSGGGGFALKDLIGMWVGSTQGNVGIKAQVSTVYSWLHAGKLTSTIAGYTGGASCKKAIAMYGDGYPPGWEFVAKNRMKNNKNVKGNPNVTGNKDACMDGAFELVTAWYQEGFIRLDDDQHTGFNAEMGSWWPCGAMFTYASAIDITVMGVMELNKYDSLQQLCEPQHSQGSMRPAYVTEIVKAIQKRGAKVDWLHSDSSDRSGCESSYIVNPTDDWDTWKTHGYVAGEKTLKSNGGSGVLSFDHRIMPLTPALPDKAALENKSWTVKTTE